MTERKAPARKRKPAPEPTAPEPDAEPGYVGDLPDDTPNEHYTLRGVIAGLPVPEHDK